MRLDSFEAVLLAFAFLMPGFVWSGIYAMLIPRRSESEQNRFMEFFTLSCLNNAFWSWLIYLWYDHKWYVTHSLLTAAAVFLVVFLSPAAAALASAQFRQRGWIALFVDWLGFQSARWNTTAWDFKLSETDPVWVNVTLKDGNHIYGWFGEGSFAGDSGPSADIYLERTAVPAEDETGGSTESGGVWIASDQIAIIQFVESGNG
ncbi:MAG TPA: DUF6338 family protein [Acidobacteriaceae bacterium]|nr:DUF6338 family protein [Acidobacteriaceae bacterium]